ncbi:MAG: ABC transporter permease [Pseudonocardiales bacterium]|nr:ABC transporter permease [Actinomycetota bacterium]
MSTLTYTRLELLRTVRNRQSMIFSLGFPIVMYFLLAGLSKGSKDFLKAAGISAPQYYMVGLLSFGAMVAVLSGGARIAAERTIGWNRQLRLTPLSALGYLRAKVLTSYVMALGTVILLYAAGIVMGVRLPISSWLEMTGLVIVALIPFAGLGIGMGHLLNDDSAGAAIGGGVGLLAFLGGTWFPITGGGFFVDLCQSLPSYWLVQAGHVGLGASNPWGAKGWIVIAVWSAATITFAAWAYRRDTKRV